VNAGSNITYTISYSNTGNMNATGVVITDTIPLPPEKKLEKIQVLSVAPLLGEAIKRIHRNESVSKLFV